MGEQTGKSREPKRSGTEEAAILLLTIGEQSAAEVLRHLGAKDVQRLGSVMAQLGSLSRDDVTNVLTRFGAQVDNQTSIGVGADEYVRKMLVGALGEEEASGLIDSILLGRASKGLEALKWMDARGVAEMIRHEHPQIIAIVLAYLDADQSAGVLELLPEQLRADVVTRIATLDGIQPSALTELDEIMEKQFVGNAVGRNSVLGGPKAAANILNALDPSQESAILEHIRGSDEALGSRIEELIFTFDDLLDIDDRGMQELLRQVPGDRLVIALKGADDALRQKVFRNMSQRAADMLKDDLEARGPTRLSEVEGAQKEILDAARKLAEAGTIALGGKGEEYV